MQFISVISTYLNVSDNLLATLTIRIKYIICYSELRELGRQITRLRYEMQKNIKKENIE